MTRTFRIQQNKYSKWYGNIVSRALQRKIEGYTEKHHILPSCLGGNNEHTNIVRLTAREHYLVHWLLTKFVDGPQEVRSKLLAAFAIFAWKNPRLGRNLTARQFAKAREKKALSAIGNKNAAGNRGKPKSAEHRKKISLGQLGNKRSAETRAIQSALKRGKSWTVARRQAYEKRYGAHI